MRSVGEEDESRVPQTDAGGRDPTSYRIFSYLEQFRMENEGEKRPEQLAEVEIKSLLLLINNSTFTYRKDTLDCSRS